MCSCFGWDKDGDLLAIVTDKSPNLIIWDAHSDSGKEQLIDTSQFSFSRYTRCCCCRRRLCCCCFQLCCGVPNHVVCTSDRQGSYDLGFLLKICCCKWLCYGRWFCDTMKAQKGKEEVKKLSNHPWRLLSTSLMYCTFLRLNLWHSEQKIKK